LIAGQAEAGCGAQLAVRPGYRGDARRDVGVASFDELTGKQVTASSRGGHWT